MCVTLTVVHVAIGAYRHGAGGLEAHIGSAYNPDDLGPIPDPRRVRGWSHSTPRQSLRCSRTGRAGGGTSGVDPRTRGSTLSSVEKTGHPSGRTWPLVRDEWRGGRSPSDRSARSPTHMPLMPWRLTCPSRWCHGLGKRRYRRTTADPGIPDMTGGGWCLRAGHGNGWASAFGHGESPSGDHRGCVGKPVPGRGSTGWPARSLPGYQRAG
jgi:hypothetical protein